MLRRPGARADAIGRRRANFSSFYYRGKAGSNNPRGAPKGFATGAAEAPRPWAEAVPLHGVHAPRAEPRQPLYAMVANDMTGPDYVRNSAGTHRSFALVDTAGLPRETRASPRGEASRSAPDPAPDPAPGATGARRGSPLARFYLRFGKRALDLALVAAFAPLVAPLVFVLALLVARDGGAPFYAQMRVGRDGAAFRMLKLRTMVPNAECVLAGLLSRDAAAAAEWEAHQKLRRDPRVTRVGQFLRRSSLDELPQLWNVVRGEMSLVGPRPMMPSQMSLYPGDAYFALRPGITGLWQVSERHENTFASRAEYDALYLETLSLSLDLRTLARTCGVVVRGTGC